MCGRFQLDFSNPDKFKSRFNIGGNFPKARIKTSYNIRPGTDQPVIVTHSPNSVEIMLWGFIPSYEEKKDKPFGLINIRSDSLSKGWIKKDLLSGRCVIPASGFYEPKGPKGTKNRPQYFFKLKNDDYMSFAGLYREYTKPSGEKIHTFAIITVEPNNLVGSVHNRMPVILDKDSEIEWLNPDNSETDHLLNLLKPYPENEMVSWPVSLRVNKWSEDDHGLIEPLKEEKKLSTLF